MQTIIVAQLAQWAGISYQKKAYPAWAEFLGWCLALASMILIPLFAILQYIKAKGYGVEQVGRVTYNSYYYIDMSVLL